MSISINVQVCRSFFFFNDTATTEIYTLSYTTLFRSLFNCRRQIVLVFRHQDFIDLLSRTRHRSEEHTSALQSRFDLVCRLLLEKKKKAQRTHVLEYQYQRTNTSSPTRRQ